MSRRKVYVTVIEPSSSGVAPTTPTYSSSEIGTINAYTIPVTFSEDISASNYAAGVTIKVNGVSTTITSATRQSNHAIVRYVIPVLYHGSGDVVTWEYNSAVGNIVSEDDATALGNVPAQTVTNNILWAALLDLQADIGVTTSVTGFAGSGTVAQVGNDITGVGTAFLSEVVVGDVITGVGINGTVTAITDDDTLALSSSATAEAVTYTITPQAGTARVTSWADQSGGSHNVTASGVTRPSKQTISSYPTIVFDGISGNPDQMADGNIVNNLSSFTIITVVLTPTSAGGYLMFKEASIFDTPGWYIKVGDVIEFYVIEDGENFLGTTSNGMEDEKYVVAAEKVSNSISNVYVNGVEDSTDDSFGTVTTFSNAENLKLGFAGAVQDYATLILSPNPSATDRAALEIRLGARYGITI